MRRLLVLVALVVAVAGSPATAVQEFALYDDFSGKTINHQKWFGSEPLLLPSPLFPGFDSTPTEATRALKGNQLHLFQRTYARTDADTGGSMTFLRMHYLHPGLVTAMKATVKVIDTEATACPSSSVVSSATFLLQGHFFNAASPTPGSAVDDVVAAVRIVRGPSLPAGTLQVNTQIARCADEKCVGGFLLAPLTVLGTVDEGVPVTVAIRWDPDNNRFLFQLNNDPEVPVTYSVTDTAAAGVPEKYIGLFLIVPGCTGAPRPVASFDATIDNVFVNASAVP